MGRTSRATMLLVATSVAGCTIQLHHDVANPERTFAEARDKVRHLQGRRGRAVQLNVLAYDPDDRELLRVQVPLWMLHKAVRLAEEDQARIGKAGRHLGDLTLEDLRRGGRGVQVEIEEPDGARVLIWLR